MAYNNHYGATLDCRVQGLGDQRRDGFVGRYCGLDTSGSAFYLAAWESDDPEVVRERLDRIGRTAERIMSRLKQEPYTRTIKPVG